MTRLNRCARIRAWLATQAIPASARDVMRAVEPKGDFAAIAASLSAMAKSGLVRVNKVGRLAYYTAGRAPTSHRERRPAKSKATRKAAAKRATKKPAAATPLKSPPTRPVPRALPGPPPPSDALRATIGTLARTRAVARPAPVTCSLDGVSEQQRQASARIAADIAAFEARGGRIERLGPTKFFDRIGMEAANHTPPRRSRTGTLDLDD